MLAGPDIVIFLKSNDDLETAAQLVFGALKTPYEGGSSEEWGGQHYRASGLGFEAVLFANQGEMLDPEFEEYPVALDLAAQFWCPDLDSVDIEGALSEYYARQLAFDLNVETATELLLDTTEEAEIFEIRAFRRNPQFRLDQAPTTPKVFVVETRQVEEPFEEEEDEEWADEDVEDVEEGDEDEG